MTSPLSRTCAAALLLAVLSACGGGGGDGGDPGNLPPMPQVTDIRSQASLSFGRTATLLVEGTHLDQGINLTAPGCSGLTELSGGGAGQRSYSCRVTGPTMLDVTALRSGGGGMLRSVSLPVPDPQVTVTVSSTTAGVAGSFLLELDPVAAPISVENFLRYTNDGFYTGTLFHRVIADLVVQAGGFTTGPTPKPPTHPAIRLESNNGLRNTRGTVGAARTPAPDSATSQFYVNVMDNPGFDFVSTAQPGFAVFGVVVGGMELIDAIRVVPTATRNGLNDVPVTDVVIESATQTR